MIARAIDVFCFMPVDILAPSRSRISCIWSRSNTSSMRSRSSVVVHAVESAEVLDHFPGSHAVVDGRVGGNEADLVADHFGLGDAIEAADDGCAAGGLQHRAEDAEGGCFAGSVGAEEAVDLAGLGDEGYARKCEDFTAQQVGVRLGK